MAGNIEVYFVTNRDLLDESGPPWFGPRFNVDGPFALRFGVARGKLTAGLNI